MKKHTRILTVALLSCAIPILAFGDLKYGRPTYNQAERAIAAVKEVQGDTVAYTAACAQATGLYQHPTYDQAERLISAIRSGGTGGSSTGAVSVATVTNMVLMSSVWQAASTNIGGVTYALSGISYSGGMWKPSYSTNGVEAGWVSCRLPEAIDYNAIRLEFAEEPWLTLYRQTYTNGYYNALGLATQYDIARCVKHNEFQGLDPISVYGESNMRSALQAIIEHMGGSIVVDPTYQAKTLDGKSYDFNNGTDMARQTYSVLTNVIRTLGGNITNPPVFD